MKRVSTLAIAVVLFVSMTGCEPDEHYHGRMLGGHLKYIYEQWKGQGCPAVFEPTNYFYVVGTTNQYFIFTNKVDVQGVPYHSRFAIRDPNRFRKPGVLVISDEMKILWIGDDGKNAIVDTNKWWSD